MVLEIAVRMTFSKIRLYTLDKQGDIREIANKVAIAKTFFPRFFGLMFTSKLKKKHALVMYPCSSIHMFFMNYQIDVIYTNKDFEVVRVVKGVDPWKIDFGHKEAKYTIELPAGTIQSSKPDKIILTRRKIRTIEQFLNEHQKKSLWR